MTGTSREIVGDRPDGPRPAVQPRRARASPASSSSSGCAPSVPPDETSDDARLVVSELVGNAVRHARPLADGTMHVAWTSSDRGRRHRRHRRRRPDHPRARRGRRLRPRRSRPRDRGDPRLALVGGEHPLPHHRARAARAGLTAAAPLARTARCLVFGHMGKKSRQRNRTEPPHRPLRRHPEPSARASPVPAARAAATRPATAARPEHRRPSSPVRSRDWPARPTSSRCASSSQPPPRPLDPGRQRPHRPALLAAARRRARTGPRGRHHLARAPGPALVRRPEPRPGRRTHQGARRRAGQHGRPDRGTRRRPAPAGPGPRRAADGHRARTASTTGWPTSTTPTARWRRALEQANEAASPTERLTSVEAAYWTSVGNREYLRWVLPDDEDRVLDGLARLHATDAEHLVDGDRLIGMFRAHGLVVPVWDLPLGHRRRGPRGARRAGALGPA